MITFSYVPWDISWAANEMIALWYKRKDRIGILSKTLGGQESITFSQSDMTESIKNTLQDYKNVVPLYVPDLLYTNLLNERKWLRRIDELPDHVVDILRRKAERWTRDLYEMVKDNIRERLGMKTGRLQDDVQMEFLDDGVRFEGRVYIAGNPYAQIQEEGGAIPPHIIRPRQAKILAFMSATGDKVFAMRVFHPGGTIPATHYMKGAYREKSAEVTRGIRAEVMRDLKRAMR